MLPHRCPLQAASWFFAWALIVAIAWGSAAAVEAEDWPCWRGARGNGTWHGPPLPDHWPEEGPNVRWRRPIGGGYAGVAVVGQRVYTMDRRVDEASEREEERVVCFDLDDGHLVWQYAYPVRYGDLAYGNGPRAMPTVYDGRVYTVGAVGHVHCLDAETGRPVWSKDFVADHQAELPEWGLAASPVVRDRLVLLHVGVPGGCLLALDRRTGQEVWRCGDDPAGYATPIVVRHAGWEALVCWSPRHVLAVAPEDGRLLWSIPYKVTYGVSIATPIVHRGILFITGYWEGAKAIGLGATREAADLIWENNRYLRGLMSQPLYRDGYVYCLDKTHGLVCFEIETGRKRWEDRHRMTPRGRNPQATMVWTGHDDHVLVLNSEGELIHARFRPEGYLELDRAKLLGPTWAHPAYAGRWVVARNDEEIVCASLTNE